jgi:DNA polymerase III sliding clamp (beta) subunit (PCNA family)
MLDALKFVKGAVAPKSFVPELSHFKIKGGYITSYNGTMSLCSPIAIDIEAAPKAIPFIKAIEACNEPVSIHLTKANKLGIKSGNFKAFIDCLQDQEVPELVPSGVMVEAEGEEMPDMTGLLPALKKVFPFIADDASRQWARGVLFKGQSIFATNNISLVEHWLPFRFPLTVNVPQEAIKELLRINENPVGLQMSDNTLTFHFTDGRWLETQLYETTWPPLQDILNRESAQREFTPHFFDALETLLPFADDMTRAYISPDKIATSPEEQTGSTVEIDASPTYGIFNMKQLLLLKTIANTIDFTGYPAPCIFYGDMVRGAIMGMAS